MQTHHETNWLSIGAAFVVAIFVVVAAGCPSPPPPKAGPSAEIVVEDMHAAAWMPIDNELFIYENGKAIEEHDPQSEAETGEADHEHSPEAVDAGHPSHPIAVCPSTEPPEGAFGACERNYVDETHSRKGYRHGILVQMGDNKACDAEGEPFDISYFEGLLVRYRTADGEIEEREMLPSAFDWVDVNPAGAACVLDPLHAYSMFNNPLVENDCDGGDTEFTCTEVEGKHEPDPDYSCRRRRSLHASVIAERILTFWSGEEYYGVVADETADLPADSATHGSVSHVSYSIQPRQAITADIWKGGCWTERLDDVVEIRVRFHDSDATHLGFDHLPIDGGNIGRR